MHLIIFLSLKKISLLVFLAVGLWAKKFRVFLTIYSEIEAQLRKHLTVTKSALPAGFF